MKRLLSFLVVILISTIAFAQSVTLTFTAKDAANQHVQLNRVSITNLTKGWQETIYWPDTTLTMQNGTGISDIVGANDYSPLRLSQNNPNPFTGTTEVNLMVRNEGTVALDIADINGRIVVVNDYTLQPGPHQFRITLATAGTYVMTARQSGQTSSIKMVCNGGTDANKMEYTGVVMLNDYLPKSAKSNPRGATNNPFTFGDQMEYVGYATINCNEAESQHITQVQETSQTFTLQFSETQHQLPIVTTNTITSITTNSATCGGDVTSNGASSVTACGVCWSTSQNPTVSESYTTDGSGTGSFTSNITGLTTGTTYYVRAYATNSAGTSYGEQRSFTAVVDAGVSCPGAATVTDYDNNTYNTVQIGNQCWMKENLRTTHYSDGTSIPMGNSTSNTTAYYYVDNNISNVSTYGYLYNWPAVMGNSSSSSANPSGVQGICPTGWHVPSDAEWTQLSDYVGSQTQYQCSNNSDYIAKALASTSGWAIIMSNLCAVGLEPSSNNSTGFSALPAGCYGSNLSSFGSDADFWSATQIYGNFVYYRQITYSGAYLYRNGNDKSYRYSVRCLRD
ncbi:MAG: T9SS type A sorting domain-containing protein [Bacteroidales bacterium]|nr:T9SS type A sorting domain-containing protein [Bacteroidales bacterium]